MNYKQELILIFDHNTIVLNKDKIEIRISDIPEISVLLDRNAKLYVFNKDTCPSFIKLFPTLYDTFVSSDRLQDGQCYPILSFHLKAINPEWNEWVHLVIPSNFVTSSFSDNYIYYKKYEGWDSTYDFICILDENSKFIIEQGTRYLDTNKENIDMRVWKEDFEKFKTSNKNIELCLNAKYDWYNSHHEKTYFMSEESEIIHILTFNEFNMVLHLFYQPNSRRVIHFAQY